MGLRRPWNSFSTPFFGGRENIIGEIFWLKDFIKFSVSIIRLPGLDYIISHPTSICKASKLDRDFQRFISFLPMHENY
jgi:hypothetical protein